LYKQQRSLVQKRKRKKVTKKRNHRRSKIQIYGDLLRIIDAQTNVNKIVLSRIQVQIDVPFDRLKKYLSELRSLKLIEKGNTLKLTQKGKEYMQEYESIVDFIERLSPPPTESRFYLQRGTDKSV